MMKKYLSKIAKATGVSKLTKSTKEVKETKAADPEEEVKHERNEDQPKIEEETKAEETKADAKPNQKPRGVVLVNNYQPPKDKTLEDCQLEVQEKVKHLELEPPQKLSGEIIQQKLRGK